MNVGLFASLNFYWHFKRNALYRPSPQPREGLPLLLGCHFSSQGSLEATTVVASRLSPALSLPGVLQGFPHQGKTSPRID